MGRIGSRILWGAAGALLIAAGVVCLLQPAVTLEAMGVFLGIAMLVSGVIDLAIFAHSRNAMLGAGWFLADGVLTILLSLFLLFDQTFTILALPTIFGMWLMFSGIVRFVHSFELRTFGAPGWGWFTAWGLFTAAAGFLSFLNPLASALALSAVVGFLLVMQGVSYLLRAILGHRFFR